VFIDGGLEATVTANCCRCLEGTHLPVKTNFRYTFVPEKKRVEAGRRTEYGGP
jgi:uncharacterized metal-binding protein YceD (DUF177 family)